MRFAKKSLGQNFLIDKNIINKIINLTNIKDRDIIEIGPGRGALTDQILKKKPKSLNIIEKDTDLAKKLREKYLDKKNVNVFNNDILKFDLKKLYKKILLFLVICLTIFLLKYLLKFPKLINGLQNLMM